MNTDIIQKQSANSKQPAVLLFLTFFAYLFFLTPLPADNVLSRADLTASIIIESNLDITEYHQNTLDKSFISNKYFSDKAPGVSLFSIPAAYVYSIFSKPDPDNKIFVQIITIFSVTLPAMLLVLIFFKSILTVSSSENVASAMTFSLAFCTLIFPYSTLLYGHVPGAAISFLIFYIIFFSSKTPLHLLLAGVLSAWLTITEYPLASHSAIFLIFLFIRLEKKNRILYFIAGALPLAISFLIYNKYCYGGYFTIGYFHESWKPFEAGMNQGVAGVTYPSISALLKILFNPGRGLLPVSPLLILVIPGFLAALKNNIWKQAAICALILICASITINSSQYLPLGGMAPGPRHLIPVIPYFIFLISFSMKSDIIKKYAFPFLAGFSFLAALCFTGVEPHVHEIFDVPFFEFYLPSIRKGIFRESWISHFQPSSLLFSAVLFLTSLIPITYFLISRTNINSLHFLSISITGIFMFTGLQFTFFNTFSSHERLNKNYTKASTWQHIGFTKSAEKTYSEIIDIDPEHYLSHFNLGIIDADKNNTSMAIVHFSNAVRANPGFSQAHFNLARILMDGGRLDESLKHFNLAISTDEFNNLDIKASSYASMTLIYHKKKEYNKMNLFLSMAKETFPANPYVLKVETFINRGNRDK